MIIINKILNLSCALCLTLYIYEILALRRNISCLLYIFIFFFNWRLSLKNAFNLCLTFLIPYNIVSYFIIFFLHLIFCPQIYLAIIFAHYFFQTTICILYHFKHSYIFQHLFYFYLFIVFIFYIIFFLKKLY
jgi:hypothetical protein